MSGCKRWFHVWRGNFIDEVFETKISAKKHAAWLLYTYGKSENWWRKIRITLEGEEIPFDDYVFKNGDSRKIGRECSYHLR